MKKFALVPTSQSPLCSKYFSWWCPTGAKWKASSCKYSWLFGFVWFSSKGIQRRFDNVAVGLMKTNWKSLAALLLTSTGNWKQNTHTHTHTHTHYRLNHLSLMPELQPLLSEMSVALFGQRHYRDRGCGEGGSRGHFPLFLVGKPPKPRCPTLRQGEFLKQPLIHRHYTQTHTCQRIPFTHT